MKKTTFSLLLGFILFLNLKGLAQTQAVGWFLDSPTPTTGSNFPRPHGGADVPTINSTYISSATAISAGPGVNIYRETSGGFWVTFWEVANVNSCTFAQAQTNNDYVTATITIAQNAPTIRLSQSTFSPFSGAGVSSGSYSVGLTMTDITAGSAEQVVMTDNTGAEPGTHPNNATATTVISPKAAASNALYLQPGHQYRIKWYIYGVTIRGCINAGVKEAAYPSNRCNTVAASRGVSCSSASNIGFDNPTLSINTVAPVTFSGTVYNDADGPSNGISNLSGAKVPGLNAVLVNAEGKVVAVSPVSATNGTYSFTGINPAGSTSFRVMLTTGNPIVAQSAPAAASLPFSWISTGENIGTGTGTDGNPNGISNVFTPDAGVTNIDFGIQHISINPDFNSTYVNVATPGNIATNNIMPTGSSYGTPVVPSGVTNPGSAVPAMNPDGSYSFTAATPGVYTFDVPVCTGTPAVCVMNRLTITVADPDIQTNPPVANPDLAATSGTTPVTIKTLANDQPGSNSPALNPGSVSILTAPKNGTATRNATTGDITYTPNEGFVGQDTIYYQVCNTATPAPQCSPSYQVITVDPAGTNNTSATDDYNVTTINTAVSGNVKTNDIDAQGNTTTVTAKTETITGKGTLSIAADGSYTFTPVNGYTGPVNFTYTICDNGTPSVCANASLYLLVQPNSTLPVVFGSITAYFKDGILYVNWNTQTEKRCKEYSIEGSIDGVNWKTVGTVLSKARDGNSDTPLNYEFSAGMAATAFAGMGLALLLLMPGIRNKRIKWLMILAATFTIVACSKKMADEVATGDTPTYIRILQKDIDGTVSYSKIVQVIKK